MRKLFGLMTLIIPLFALSACGSGNTDTSSSGSSSSSGGGGSSPPTITRISPAEAVPGTSITINGTNFPSTTSEVSVTINDVACDVTSISSTQIVCTVEAMRNYTGPVSVFDSTSGFSVQSASSFSVVNPLYGVGPSEATNSGYVVAGANGTVMHSDDGISWTLPTGLYLPHNMMAVASADGVLIVVGENGVIMDANSGISFIYMSIYTSHNLYGTIGYTIVGTRYLAVGGSGTIFLSQDGSSWNKIASPTTTQLDAAAWSGSQLVVCGQNATVLTSPDGNIWTQQTASAAGGANLLGAAYGNGTFVLVGDGGTIIYSTDGSTWTSTTSNTSNTLHGVVWSGSMFVAVGDHGTILNSSDGVNWNVVSSSAANGNALNAVTYGNNTSKVAQFVAVGANGTIITSTDGSTWAHQQGI